MSERRIYRDSWYPVYDLGTVDNGLSVDPVSQFTDEEISAMISANAEFDKWQKFLENRYRRQKEAKADE